MVSGGDRGGDPLDGGDHLGGGDSGGDQLDGGVGDRADDNGER